MDSFSPDVRPDVLDTMIASSCTHYQQILDDVFSMDNAHATENTTENVLKRMEIRHAYFEKAREDPSSVNATREDWPRLFTEEEIDNIALEIFTIFEPDACSSSDGEGKVVDYTDVRRAILEMDPTLPWHEIEKTEQTLRSKMKSQLNRALLHTMLEARIWAENGEDSGLELVWKEMLRSHMQQKLPSEARLVSQGFRNCKTAIDPSRDGIHRVRQRSTTMSGQRMRNSNQQGNGEPAQSGMARRLQQMAADFRNKQRGADKEAHSQEWQARRDRAGRHKQTLTAEREKAARKGLMEEYELLGSCVFSMTERMRTDVLRIIRSCPRIVHSIRQSSKQEQRWADKMERLCDALRPQVMATTQASKAAEEMGRGGAQNVWDDEELSTSITRRGSVHYEQQQTVETGCSPTGDEHTTGSARQRRKARRAITHHQGRSDAGQNEATAVLQQVAER